jgi:hypothetical protein
MSEKKKFLLRVDADVFAALEKWAADDLRSINAQMEFLLADALKKSKRAKGTVTEKPDQPAENSEEEGRGTL